MSLVPFEQLPDHARLWIFPADRRLQPAEVDVLRRTVEESLAGWNAHGSLVRWGFTVEREQVLLIGVDETHTALSGCSIDACVRRIRELESALETGFLDNGRVFYRDGDALRRATRPEFRRLVESGAVDLGTVVCDNVLATVGDFRAGRWEVPARDAWHAGAFPFRP